MNNANLNNDLDFSKEVLKVLGRIPKTEFITEGITLRDTKYILSDYQTKVNILPHRLVPTNIIIKEKDITRNMKYNVDEVISKYNNLKGYELVIDHECSTKIIDLSSFYVVKDFIPTKDDSNFNNNHLSNLLLEVHFKSTTTQNRVFVLGNMSGFLNTNYGGTMYKEDGIIISNDELITRVRIYESIHKS